MVWTVWYMPKWHTKKNAMAWKMPFFLTYCRKQFQTVVSLRLMFQCSGPSGSGNDAYHLMQLMDKKQCLVIDRIIENIYPITANEDMPFHFHELVIVWQLSVLESLTAHCRCGGKPFMKYFQNQNFRLGEIYHRPLTLSILILELIVSVNFQEVCQLYHTRL